MFPLRRKTTTLVDARRVQSGSGAPVPPIVIDSSTGSPVGSTQPTGANPTGATNIFVIAPNGVPQSATPAQPPTEIHHHHTTVQYVARKRTTRLNTSFFGSAGVVLGVLAALAAYESASYLVFARPLALGGLIAGGIGFLGAIVFRRTRTGLPMLALILSAVGYVGWMYDSGQVDDLRSQLSQFPKVDWGQPTAPATPAHTAPVPSKH